MTSLKQREIDVSNLRFYAEMFKQHEWSTVVIHWGVFEQTLREIADRIEQQWKPIETAPKDGARLLLHCLPDNKECPDCRANKLHAYSDATTPGFFPPENCARHREGFITVGWWDPKFSNKWNEESETLEDIGAWTDGVVVSFNYEETRELHPTDWMPLPRGPHA